MIRNLVYNTDPFLLHYPTLNSDAERNKINLIWEQTVRRKLKQCLLPQDITLVTWNSKDQGFLETQLNEYGIKYICLGKNLEWTANRLKPLSLLNYIDNIKTKYIMGLDCYDVFIVRDFSNILNEFHSYDKKLLFNSTYCVWPSNEEDQKKENAKIESKHYFRYFNSGMFLGETDFVKNVFENIDWFQKSGSNSWVFDYSDQYLLRKAYHVNESIGLDYLCRVFQLNKKEKRNLTGSLGFHEVTK